MSCIANNGITTRPVYDELLAKLKSKVDSLVIGDPTERATHIGPVVNQNSYNEFKNFTEEINQAGGRFLTGGNVKSRGMYDYGYYCEPTLVTNLPFEHRLWKDEMFLPIATIGKVKNLDEAMGIANVVNYGLTAGFLVRPKKLRGSSITSKPVRRTRTVRKARQPARGPASNLSAAGKAPAQAAKTAADTITPSCIRV